MPLIHLLALYGFSEMSEEKKLNYSHLGEILSVCKPFGSKIHENSKNIKMIQPRKVGVEDNGDERGIGDKYHRSIFMKQFYEDIPSYSTPLSSGSPHAARLVSRAQSEKEEEDYDYCPEEEDCKKTILVGSQHQAVIPEGLCKYDDALPYENEDKLLWDPSSLTADEIENYLLKAQEPLAVNNAHSISSARADFHKRDDEQALYLLLQCGYNVEEALRRRRMNVVAPTDTMSLWSEEECRNFENGLRTYGKNFHLIQQNKVRTRSVGELVQFYYLWKKTERHDTFANKAKYEKKKYTLHPGITDFMDRFLEEQESGGGSSGCGNTTNNNSQRDRSSSPNIQCLIYGDRKRHHRSDKTTDHLSKDSVLISSSVAYFSIKDGAGPSSEISESGVRISESNFIVPRIVNSDVLSEERSIIKK